MIGFTPSEGSNPGARFTVTGEFPALLVPPAFEVLAPSPSLPPPQRAVRQAAQPQPCPVCDAEGQRIMPTTVHAFMMRDGVPRRIPDRGKFWHYGEEVDAPIGRPIQMGEHPELIYERYGPPTPPTMEEREAQEELLLARM